MDNGKKSKSMQNRKPSIVKNVGQIKRKMKRRSGYVYTDWRKTGHKKKDNDPEVQEENAVLGKRNYCFTIGHYKQELWPQICQ